jgi:hypothetical protein
VTDLLGIVVSSVLSQVSAKTKYARPGIAVAGACCLILLGGCAPRTATENVAMARNTGRAIHVRTKPSLPVVNGSLLRPQLEPDCAFKGPPSNPVTNEEIRMKLDYEQQCYRQAESIVRERLQQLQDAVARRNR